MVQEWWIRIQGHVQGVGFRVAVVELARLHQITGFVRNCSDGTVEICAQAPEKNLQAFLESVRKPRLGSIENITIEKKKSSQKFSAFMIN